MQVRTNYGTGPYIVTKVHSGCTDPSFLDTINCPMGQTPPPSPEHTCLTCKNLGGKERGDFYLNGYDENLNNVWRDDRLIDLQVEALTLAMIAVL